MGIEEQLRGRTCVVTGAAGFIGRVLCARLAAAGAAVKGLDIEPSAAPAVEQAGATFSVCDTTDAAGVRAALAGAELVVHAAARVSDWGPMDDFVRVNVQGTHNVLEAAADARSDRVVHVSSVATWGYEHETPLDEDAPPRPCGIPYIDTKGASDALALARARMGEPIAVVRPGDVYGPGSTPWAVRPMAGLKGRRFMLINAGAGLMTPVYIDDLVEAIVLALTVPGAAGRGYTVWDGRAVSAAEFFGHYARMLERDRIPSMSRPLATAAAAGQELAARVTGRPPVFTRNAISFVSRKAPYSNRRATEVLGWRPKVTLDEGMRRTETWFKEQGML